MTSGSSHFVGVPPLFQRFGEDVAATRTRASSGLTAGRLLTVLALLSSSTACYQYVPTSDVTPGSLVRARLTVAGTDTLTQRLGPGVEEVMGTYLGSEDGAMSLLVSEFVSARGGRQTMWNEALRVPRGGIARLEQREFSRTKSVLFGAGVVAALSVAYVALDIGSSIFEDAPDTEPGPTDMRGILIRIPLGWPGR